MNEVRTIAVGSQNPVKIAAALKGFETMFPGQSFSAIGYHVESGVPDQPMSCDETLQGATNRSTELRSFAPADFFVGIEGGIEIIEDTYFANAWVVIADTVGKFGRGRSGSFALPPEVQALVRSGMELGHANDKVFSEHNSKQAGGAVGSLTRGVVSRQSLYEHAIALALIAFAQPDLF
jgi:inosine/xanthosine triphosphatase